TLLDVDPPRFKRKAPALVAHLTLLQTGSPEAVLEEHIRHVGAAGVRLATLAGRVPFGPERLRGLLDALQPAGRVIAVDRDWFIHPDSFAGLRTLVVEALTAFHRARSEEHTSELQSRSDLVCRLLLEKKNNKHQ